MRSALYTTIVLFSMLGALTGCTKDAPTTPDPTPKKYAVKGTVTPKVAEAVDGVTITMGARTATTSSTGAYAFNDVDTGSYVVTPTKTGFTFAPSSKNVKVTSADVTGIDFVATGAVAPTHLVPEMIAIEPGTFMMGGIASQPGGENSKPQHEVTLTKAYWIAKTEITQAQYQSVMGTNPSWHVGSELPVNAVSAINAMVYCNKLSIKEGLDTCYVVSGDKVTWNKNANGYRLPTDAEWEYAARAGTTDNTYNGICDGKTPNAVLDPIAWYSYNSASGPPFNGRYSTPKAVSLKRPNSWGLYDMLGNIQEWVYGRVLPYTTAPQTDPVDDPTPDNIISRGNFFRDGPTSFAITSRIAVPALQFDDSTGFRIAKNK